MQLLRVFLYRLFGFAVAAATLLAAVGALAIAAAQDGSDDTSEADDAIEEIVVVAGKKLGDPVDLEALHEEMMRDRLMIDIKRLEILEEQNEWRSPSRTTAEKKSRIEWGYKPEDDARMGRESGLSDESYITTKPASLFRFEF